MWFRFKNIFYKSIVVFLIAFITYYALSVILSAKTLAMTGDVSEYYNNTYSILCGRKPYRDFWLLFAPLEVYTPALFASSFGYNVIAWGIVIAPLFNALLVFMLLERISSNSIVNLLLSFLFSIWGSKFFYFGICLLSLHTYLSYKSTVNQYYLMLAGIITGIATLFRVYHVAPFIVSIFFLLLFIVSGNNKKKIADLIVYSIGLVLPNIVCYYLLGVDISLVYKSLIRDSVIHGTSMNYPYWLGFIESYNKIFIYYAYYLVDSVAYDIKGLVFMIADALFNLCLRLIPLLALLFIGIDFIRFRIVENKSLKIILFVWGILFLPYAFNLSEEQHIKQAFSPFIILLLLYLNERKQSNAFKIILTLLFSLSFLTIYNSFKPTSNHFYTITKNKISYTTIDQEYYHQLVSITNTITENSTKTDNIFCLAWDIIPLNVFCDRANKTYYDSPIDLLINSNPEKENRLINDIHLFQTKIIIIQRGYLLQSYYNYSFENRNFKLLSYIRSHYYLLKQVGIYDIYIINK